MLSTLNWNSDKQYPYSQSRYVRPVIYAITWHNIRNKHEKWNIKVHETKSLNSINLDKVLQTFREYLKGQS